MRRVIVCGFLIGLATGVLSANGVCGTGFTDGSCATQATGGAVGLIGLGLAGLAILGRQLRSKN